MTKSRKLTSIKFETSSGTLTDITSFVKSVEWKPYKPSIWRRLFNWLYWKWFKYSADVSWAKLSKNATIEITVEKRINNPWKWN